MAIPFLSNKKSGAEKSAMETLGKTQGLINLLSNPNDPQFQQLLSQENQSVRQGYLRNIRDLIEGNRRQALMGRQQYFDPEINENYIPYVVETSVGADRLFLAILCNAYTEETVGEGDQEKQRVFLNFHPALAPVKVAVLPLVKKDGLAEKAQEITNSIKFAFNTTYDDGGAIGKRYTRQDLIGTPYCVVVDYQTMEDNTVTVRDRNTMTQERISIADLKEKIGHAVSMERIFEKLV